MAELSEPRRLPFSADPVAGEHPLSKPPGEAESQPSAPAPRSGRTWLLVGTTEDFTNGSSRIVNIGGRSIGIVRVGDSFYALRNVCPHQGAQLFKGGLLKGTMLPSRPDELVYGMESLVIRCPLHGWEFEVTSGNAVFGISSKRVVSYKVKVDEGRVYVLAAASAEA